MASREELIHGLATLLPSQFDQLIFILAVPLEHIRGEGAGQMQRAIDVVRYFEQPGRSTESIIAALPKVTDPAPPTPIAAHSRRRALALALGAVGLLAAGGIAAWALWPPITQAPVDLSFRARNQHGDDLRPGDVVHTGDRIAFFVTAPRPVYIYLLQFFPHGPPALLFPKGDAILLGAGQELRVPPGPTSWFQLDDSEGEENIYLIAARRPLVQADRAVAELVGQVRLSAQGARIEPPTKALVLVSDESGAMRARVGDDGAAVYRFPVRHVR